MLQTVENILGHFKQVVKIKYDVILINKMINNNNNKQLKPRLGEIILIIITKTIQTSSRLLVEVATCKVRKPPSSELLMMGKTTNGTATEGILIETDTRFSRVATPELGLSQQKGRKRRMGTHVKKPSQKMVLVCTVASPSTFTRFVNKTNMEMLNNWRFALNKRGCTCTHRGEKKKKKK
jgi:hypothetical protein